MKSLIGKPQKEKENKDGQKKECDWLIIKFGKPGLIKKLEIDTHHFKGNYPDSCSIQTASISKNLSNKSIVNNSKNWKFILDKSKLSAHKKHIFKKWLKEKKDTTKDIKKFEKSSYSAHENTSLVLNKDQIITNIKNKSFELIDARGRERFLGLQPEARKELRSGNIEGSKNMPFTELINNDRTFKKKDELMSIFEKNKVNPNKKIAFTCGSGITACVLGLTNSIISGKKPVVYDGS